MLKERKRTEYKWCIDVNLVKHDWNKSFDSEEKESQEGLRFLVHNTNLYKVRSLLV